MKKTAAALALFCVATACEQSSPTEPTVPEPRSGSPVVGEEEAELWSLDWYLESVRGDVACWIEHETSLVGTGAQGESLLIERQGGRISLTYLPDDPLAEMIYEGTLDGGAFEAGGPPVTQTFECHDGTAYRSEVSIRVTGRFAPDGRSLEAVERWVYKVDASTRVVYTYPWKAQRLQEATVAGSANSDVELVRSRSHIGSAMTTGKEIER